MQCWMGLRIWRAVSILLSFHVKCRLIRDRIAWSAFTDLVLAVFPAILLRNLQIKTSKKISIMVIMGLGFL